MERAVIIVKGDVQRVWYRDVVERFARKNGLVGYVENLRPYDVRIVVEGARKALDGFIGRIKIKNPHIIVEGVEVSHCKSTGEFSYFEKDKTIEKIDSGNKMLGGKMDVVGVKLGLFHQDTGKRFDVLDVKYCSISQNIERFIEQDDKNQDCSGKNVEKLMERMDRNFDRMVVQQEAFTEAITGLTGALFEIIREEELVNVCI